MATTYTLISSNVLSSSAASVTFSSIPATYTDLVLRYSFKSVRNATNSTIDITTNVTGSVYSRTVLRSDFNTPGSIRTSNSTSWAGRGNGSSSEVTNIFSSSELYIPNYASSANKVASLFDACEINDAGFDANWLGVNAFLMGNTTAISSITITESGANNIASGSSFYLYGISKN